MAIRIQRAKIDKLNIAQDQNRMVCAKTPVANISKSPAFKGTWLKIENDKIIEKLELIGKSRYNSAAQRLILGLTAVALQPPFDLNNKNVDEKTRKFSCARTVAKIIAGTSVGVAVRYACIKIVDLMCQENIKKEAGAGIKTAIKNLRVALLPKVENLGIDKVLLEKYKGTLGTIIATFVMLFTNVAIDAPLTKLLTNKFIKRYIDKDAAKTQQDNAIKGDEK